MDIADLIWFDRRVVDTRNVQQYVHLARFSIVYLKTEYRLWMYPAGTKREYDTYSLWRGYGANSSTNAPIFRMECELVAQAVLWGMTRDVSTEDVCIRGVSPSSIERPARDAIEASRARYPDRARQDNRDGDRRIGRGLSRLAHSPLYVYIDWIWRKLASWKK